MVRLASLPSRERLLVYAGAGENRAMSDNSPSLTRRSILAGTTAAAASLAAPALAQSGPRTFVLVHGAWHGGWCWRRVADRLERRGHKVYAPSLTGLGDRAHLIRTRPTVTTHIDDIANIIRFEDLERVILVGHSYGGIIISGVAEKVQPQLASLVFLDAFVPESGATIMSMSRQGLRDNVNAAIKRGDLGIPPAAAAYFNVNEKDRAFVDRKCTPQPIGTYGDPLKLTGARERVGKKTYIRAKGFNSAGFDAIAARLRSDPAWNVHDMPCGHDAMIDMPDRLTELLIAAA
jgi:pimeloyl-ACP methyl ester carboxylesterase